LYLAASTSSEGAINRKAAHRHLLQQTSIVASLKRVSVYGAHVHTRTHSLCSRPPFLPMPIPTHSAVRTHQEVFYVLHALSIPPWLTHIIPSLW
jgi:hypothetical protein